jgi:chromosome segregation ATPase
MTREPIDSALRGLTELSAALKEIAGKFNEIETLAAKAAKARDEVNWAESNLAGIKAKIREEQAKLEALQFEHQSKEKELIGVNSNIATSQRTLGEVNSQLQHARERLG